MTNRVLVDASAWIALFNRSDRFHSQAKAYWQTVRSERLHLLTNDYVLSEAYTLLRRGRSGLPLAIALHDLVERSAVVEIVSIEEKTREAAWELFVNYSDKVLSFADCVSFAQMHEQQLLTAFTFDRDFARAGFIVNP